MKIRARLYKNEKVNVVKSSKILHMVDWISNEEYQQRKETTKGEDSSTTYGQQKLGPSIQEHVLQ